MLATAKIRADMSATENGTPAPAAEPGSSGADHQHAPDQAVAQPHADTPAAAAPAAENRYCNLGQLFAMFWAAVGALCRRSCE